MGFHSQAFAWPLGAREWDGEKSSNALFRNKQYCALCLSDLNFLIAGVRVQKTRRGERPWRAGPGPTSCALRWPALHLGACIPSSLPSGLISMRTP